MISASHALGYYRGVLGNSSIEPKAPVPVRGAFFCSLCIGGRPTKRQVRGLSLCHDAPTTPSSWPVPTRPVEAPPRAGGVLDSRPAFFVSLGWVRGVWCCL